MASMLVACFVAVQFLACLSLASAQPFCKFTIPAYGQKAGMCANFDLSAIAHMSAFNISADGKLGWDGGDTFLLGICDTVSFNVVPIVCYEAAKAPAYRFNTASKCDALGKLEDYGVVSVPVF